MTDRVELYRSGLRRKKWRWRYVAENGNILADSGQGYVRRIDALRGAEAVTGTTFGDRGRLIAFYADRTGVGRSLRVLEVAR